MNPKALDFLADPDCPVGVIFCIAPHELFSVLVLSHNTIDTTFPYYALIK